MTAIAIVGVGGVFPGSADLEQLWEHISNARDCASEPPPGRWALAMDDVYDPRPRRADKVYSRRGCFLAPGQLEQALAAMHPPEPPPPGWDSVFGLLLAAGCQAFNDGVSEGLDRSRVGVIAGNIVLPTEGACALTEAEQGRKLEDQLRARLGKTATPASRASGQAPQLLNRFVAGFPAILLAKMLGLGGGSHTLDAACASSLYALKLAVDELESGRASAMLAGGVSRPDALYTQMGFSQLRALSPRGTCSPFDAQGDGLVVGEGAGMFLLKRLDDALAQGDHIYALLRGVGLSNDVDGSLLQPSSEGQLRALRSAYQQAGWRPDQVDLIECHATGTPVGDAVEFQSLQQLWADQSYEAGQCVLGSVKSNVGHLLTAAGAAGLMKVLLALKHETLPPTANFRAAAAKLGLEQSPFTVLQAARPWPRRAAERPRRAAVSAFGFGGINAHVLVEEYIPGAPLPPHPSPVSEPAGAPIAVVGVGVRTATAEGVQAFEERAVLRAEPLEGAQRIEAVRVPVDRFRIPPKEIEQMLPQQLLMLAVASEAAEDAGWSLRDGGRRLRTGVFVGLGLDLSTTAFQSRWQVLNKVRAWNRELDLGLSREELETWQEELRDAVSAPLTANRTMGALGGIVASRIARELKLGGPSFTVSSEGTSGLRALEVAVRALRRGELDAAVVGAVDLLASSPCPSWGLSQGPPDGDAAAALVLKRLADAQRDGDTIYAVVRGVGASVSPLSQRAIKVEQAMARAQQDAGLADPQIGLWETGRAPAPAAQRWRQVSIQIGHCGAASGLLSLLRGVLCLRSRLLPAGSGEAQAQCWLSDPALGPRRAVVGEQSAGGSCLQVILEEAPANLDGATRSVGLPQEQLVIIEADSVAALLARLGALASALRTGTVGLAALARETCRTHDAAKQRALAIVARSSQELQRLLVEALQALRESPEVPLPHPSRGVTGASRERMFYSPQPLGAKAGLAFVYPGSGNHYPGMGRELCVRFDGLRALEAETNTLRKQLQPELLWNSQDRAEMDRDPRGLILAQVTLSSAVTDVVRRFCPAPQAVIGYSLGESSGLFAARAWTERDGMLERVLQSTLFVSDLSGRYDALRAHWRVPAGEPVAWTMAVLHRPAARVRAALAAHERVYLLIINTPDSCVVGGDPAEVAALARSLGTQAGDLDGITLCHCEAVRPVADAYRELHRLETRPQPGVRFYSGATGQSYHADRESAADSLLAQALHGVDFPRVIENAYQQGARIFVEMGPGDSCSQMIRQILGERPHLARSVCVAGRSDSRSLLTLLAQLVAERVPLQLDALPGCRERRGGVYPRPRTRTLGPRGG